MNRYGAQAMTHWSETMPLRLSDLQDPEAFFTQLGEEVSQAIEELTRRLAGQQPEQETYLQRLQRLNTARQEAESQVIREMVLVGDTHPQMAANQE
ncbi:hypothetical protein OHQ88_33400 (plasmid) [Micromonospora zamorensis]|uniref:hypothetical protein n=1 Tax=Micromonospora zamorensis TaxID=709883 RepID=UPI002E1F8E34